MGWEIDHKSLWYLRENKIHLFSKATHKIHFHRRSSGTSCCQPLPAAPRDSHTTVTLQSPPSTAVPLQRHRKPRRDTGGAPVGLTAFTARQRSLRCQADIQDAIARRHSRVLSAGNGTDVFRALGIAFWSTPCQRIIEKSNEGTLSSPNGDLGSSGALSPGNLSYRGLWSFMPHISPSNSGQGPQA